MTPSQNPPAQNSPAQTPPVAAPWRELPKEPNLEQLKKQAKDLLRRYRSGDAGAIAEIKRTEKSPDPASFALADAQRVLARAYGFASWTALKQRVDNITIGHFCDAAKIGDIPTLHRMLRARPELIDMDLAASDEHRAIHFAVLNRQPKALRLLMSAGSDARKGIYPHRDATSAYQMAADRGYVDLVRIIDEEEQHRRESSSCPNATVTPIQEQINSAIRAGKSEEAMRLLQSDLSLVKACDREGGTPLHVAAGALDAATVAWLLDHRAIVTKTDLRDATPLDRAVLAVETRLAGSLKRFEPIAAMLRQRGAPITPLTAIALGDLESIRRLHAEDRTRFLPISWPRARSPSRSAIASWRLSGSCSIWAAIPMKQRRSRHSRA